MAKTQNKKPITLDEVCTLLYEGKTYRAIAEHFWVHVSAIGDFVAKPEHSARAREALIASADMYAERAEQVLQEASWKVKGQDFDLKKARELAQHYRWMAAKRNPKKYGERVTSENLNINENRNIDIDLSKLSDEELRQLADLQRKSGAGTA